MSENNTESAAAAADRQPPRAAAAADRQPPQAAAAADRQPPRADNNAVAVTISGGAAPAHTSFKCTNPGCDFTRSAEECGGNMTWLNELALKHIRECSTVPSVAEGKMLGQETLVKYSAQAGQLKPAHWNAFVQNWRLFLAQQRFNINQTRLNSTLAGCFPAITERINDICSKARDAGNELNSEELLKAVRELAVGNVDVLKQRQILHKMHQGSDEPVQEFYHRLIQQAELCR